MYGWIRHVVCDAADPGVDIGKELGILLGVNTERNLVEGGL